jgi:hypothetical protein
MVYLGSNTEPVGSQWPLASGIGASLGTVAGLVVVWAWGNRSGLMLLGGALRQRSSGRFIGTLAGCEMTVPGSR